eukprot:Blabericola_migrator_1__3348@NODE_198_length_11483_cov_213_989926_g171_i0_p4_GENE_NODE_198_length_11483_cov_213_989926_g171_i0NODE_198_length_11483_cov_213_989926_g171_i0_p4_ORF_typecomplete_len532_score52_74_NODE_198_length_11483_cov_213_989926_g171_i061147709
MSGNHWKFSVLKRSRPLFTLFKAQVEDVDESDDLWDLMSDTRHARTKHRHRGHWRRSRSSEIRRRLKGKPRASVASNETEFLSQSRGSSHQSVGGFASRSVASHSATRARPRSVTSRSVGSLRSKRGSRPATQSNPTQGFQDRRETVKKKPVQHRKLSLSLLDLIRAPNEDLQSLSWEEFSKHFGITVDPEECVDGVDLLSCSSSMSMSSLKSLRPKLNSMPLRTPDDQRQASSTTASTHFGTDDQKPDPMDEGSTEDDECPDLAFEFATQVNRYSSISRVSTAFRDCSERGFAPMYSRGDVDSALELDIQRRCQLAGHRLSCPCAAGQREVSDHRPRCKSSPNVKVPESGLGDDHSTAAGLRPLEEPMPKDAIVRRPRVRISERQSRVAVSPQHSKRFIDPVNFMLMGLEPASRFKVTEEPAPPPPLRSKRASVPPGLPITRRRGSFSSAPADEIGNYCPKLGELTLRVTDRAHHASQDASLKPSRRTGSTISAPARSHPPKVSSPRRNTASDFCHERGGKVVSEKYRHV